MLVTQAVGLMASLLSLVLWMPQAATVWKYRNDPDRLAAVSMSTQMLLLGNTALWCVYAALTDSFWVGASGVVNAPIAIGTAWILLRTRRASASAPSVSSPAVLTLVPATGPRVLVDEDLDAELAA